MGDAREEKWKWMVNLTFKRKEETNAFVSVDDIKVYEE